MVEQKRLIESKLQWQCRRGMLELDLLLQAYLEHRYEEADETEQAQFHALLAYPDQLLFDYLLGGVEASDRKVADVIQRIRTSAATAAKT